jgi:ParB family chromosome partitioning protein
MATAATAIVVSLAQLRPGHEAKPPVNIRATDPGSGDVALLAANIADRIEAGDRPLIEPLVVVEGPKPRGAPRLYYVCNGGRRLAALTRLLNQGIVTEALQLPVIVEDRKAGLEASTTAAVTAAPHHPVEQFEAFAKVAEGRPETERVGYIARRFGLTERRVRQVLALGNLAPAVRQAWRDQKINQETAQAFAVEPDQEKQAQLLADLSQRLHFLSPYDVRAALLRHRVKTNDPRVAMVGLQLYLDCGGTLTGDLFTEDRYIEDPALLQRLLDQRRADITTRLLDDGWGWVFWEGTPEAEGCWGWKWDSRAPVWTAEAEAERARLENERKAIIAAGQARVAADEPFEDDDAEIYGDDEDGEGGPYAMAEEAPAPAQPLAAELAEIDARLAALKLQATFDAYPAEARANLAVIVSANVKGAAFYPGYTPPALNPQASGDADADDTGEEAYTPPAHEPPPPPETAELPRAARQSLSLVANRAAAATLAGDPHLAMALLAAAWIIRSNRISGTDVSYTSANQVPLVVSDQGLGHGPDQIARSGKKDAPRPTFAALAAELAKAPRGLVHETLAKLAAGALDLTNDTLENRNAYAGAKHVSPAGAAAFLAALPAAAFEKNAQLILSAEADALFADWPKAALVAAVKEMDGEEAAATAAKAKKGNLVALVAERAKATGWLPESLRLTSPAQAEGDVSRQPDGDAMDDGEAGDDELGEAA